MKSSRASSQSGSVLVLMLVVTVVISVVAYVVSNLVGQVLDQLGDEDIQIEAQMLASDLREYTKYMLAYEKVTFINGPLRITDDRRNILRDMWRETFSQVDYTKPNNFANVCGGYDSLAQFNGILRYNNDEVFCPVLLRQPDLTTSDIEDMYLDRWAQSGGKGLVWRDNATSTEKMADIFEPENEFGEKFPEGIYRYRYNFSLTPDGVKDPEWFMRAENAAPIYVGQRLLDFARDPQTGFEVRADVSVDIFTDSAGFVGKRSERFFKITSNVTVLKNGRQHRFVDTESFMLRTPTPKDFAIFMLYPMDKDGVRTRKFSQAMAISASSNIRGRVFFNGDIDELDLKDLPTFHDTVFISGKLDAKVSFANVQEFRRKFRRGLVTNLSSTRFILDGDCMNAADKFRQPVLSGTGILCKKIDGNRVIADLDVFPAFADAPCKCYPREYNPNTLTWKYVPQQTPGVPCTSSLDIAQCNLGINGDKAPRFFKTSGEYNLNAQGVEFILGPIKNMRVTGKASIYGTIVGGHISADGEADFYSLTEARPGLRGIGSASTLSAMSEEANRTQNGTESPLLNFPLIQLAKDSFK